MVPALRDTHFSFPYPTERYQGKVRDVYTVADRLLVLVATDRISAFDHILPQAIPHKGQVLSQTAGYFFATTSTVCPNAVLGHPDPNVTLMVKTEPFPIEVVVRGHLAGHAWRVYREGGRELCGNRLPEGLQEGDALPEPIVTPTTKSKVGHDIDISETELVRAGLVGAEPYGLVRAAALELFAAGQRMARERGLILADTKYEFGEAGGRYFVIDEIHTPDSSRYYYAEGFEARQARREPQPQLSKEFVREWLMAQGFQGQEGATPPDMPDTFVNEVSARYQELYQRVTGHPLVPRPYGPTLLEEMEANIVASLRAAGL
ncbi:MAG: phosphoribosylaminoimidazolesuccinocarboxamide synthase [Bacteroidia bacterium]|nr:phosphoribosylaminoimidazolesuccinocarboxamide synthase [Bacteroidia bacterium]